MLRMYVHHAEGVITDRRLVLQEGMEKKENGQLAFQAMQRLLGSGDYYFLHFFPPWLDMIPAFCSY